MSPKNRPRIWRWQTIASHLIIKITESKENKSIHRLGCVYLNGSEGGSCPPCLSSNYGSDHVVFFEIISMAYYYWAVAGVLANVREHIFFQGVWRRTRQLRLTFAKKFGFLIHLKFKIIWSRHSHETQQISKAERTAVESSLTLHYHLFLFTHLFTLARLNQHLHGTWGFFINHVKFRCDCIQFLR